MAREMNEDIRRLMEETGLTYEAAKKRLQRMSRMSEAGHTGTEIPGRETGHASGMVAIAGQNTGTCPVKSIPVKAEVVPVNESEQGQALVAKTILSDAEKVYGRPLSWEERFEVTAAVEAYNDALITRLMVRETISHIEARRRLGIPIPAVEKAENAARDAKDGPLQQHNGETFRLEDGTVIPVFRRVKAA